MKLASRNHQTIQVLVSSHDIDLAQTVATLETLSFSVMYLIFFCFAFFLKTNKVESTIFSMKDIVFLSMSKRTLIVRRSIQLLVTDDAVVCDV